jgi:hypothetical protein
MASTSAIVGISFGIALLLCTYILAYNLTIGCSPFFSRPTVFWITFFLWGLTVNFMGNLFVQLSSCDRVNYEHILKNIFWIPGFMAVFLGLSSLPFFSGAVEKALPASVLAIGPREVVAYTNAYYMFWAGLFGQMISGGFSSMCPV